MATKKKSSGTPEIEAISAVYEALAELGADAQLRVIKYAAGMLGLTLETKGRSVIQREQREERVADETTNETSNVVSDSEQNGDADGINSVALKWMKRSGLDAKSLQSFFSLGIDEIDLVAKSVPGDNKKERMRNVLLLKGIAAYLGTGAPRVTYEQLKEASIHYDAYDSGNFAAYLRSFASEAGGSKSTGLTLTARGITAATELLKANLKS